MSRACTKCGEIKELSEFTTNRRMRSGRASACKICCKKQIAAYRATPKGAAATTASSRKHASKDSTVKRRKKYRASTKARIAVDDYAKRNKHKLLAKRRVHNLVAGGRLPPARECLCSTADETCLGVVEYHHDSYAETDWLSVRPLCRSHHQRWHRDNTPKPYVHDVPSSAWANVAS
jgi:hypothetical protein